MNVMLRGLIGGILALAASSAWAQSGSIRVDVVDADGVSLPGARVTIGSSVANVKTTTVLTDGAGHASFPVLRAGGGYTIAVEFVGSSPVRLSDLRVTIGETLIVPVRIIGSLEEHVRVDARPELIDLDQSETATRFSSEFIQDLPVPGRFYQNVLTMAPGVQDANEDGNPNVHGSRSRDFSAMVGGIRNVDPLTGQWMSRINPNSIEALEIITAGAGVEFGRAQGGFARVIQKQGSNDHEGVFEFFWRSSLLDGDGANDNSQLPDPEFDWVQPAFQLSGPIIRDKLWYRLSHEYRQYDEPVDTTRTVEVATYTEATHSDQLTWQISPRNKVAFQYQSDPREVTNFGISSAVSPASSQRLKRDGEIYSLTWTAPYSPSLLVESQIGWQDLNSGRFAATTGVRNDCIARGGALVEYAYCTDVQKGLDSGSYNRTEDDHSERFTFRSQATVFNSRLFGASHQFKLGLSVENERYFRHLERQPSLRFFTGQALVDEFDTGPLFSPFGRALLRVAVPVEDDVRATGTNWAVYLEDQIKPLSNLTLTAGVRVDREELNSEGRAPFDPAAEMAAFRELGGPTWRSSFTGLEIVEEYVAQLQDVLCASEPPSTVGNCRTSVAQGTATQNLRNLVHVRRRDDINLTNTNFSPSLAVAWSPGKDGKTALKATAGRYYNNIPLIIPLQELEPVVTDLQYFVDLSLYEARIDRSILPTASMTAVDRDLGTPYQDEFTLAVERELWPETTLAVTYINRRFRDQLQNANINVDIGDEGRCRKEDPFITPPVQASPGMSDPNDFTTWLLDEHTGLRYLDVDPGPGDGRIDDCVGTIQSVEVSSDAFGAGVFDLRRPDGVPDLYQLNPFWGDIFLIGNFNSIDYDAWVLELTRRQFRNWEFNGSYTWSEAKGDGEDFFQELGDDPSLRDDVFGYQSYDQRHVVKLNAATITPWGVRLGTALSWQSGLPYSVLNETRSYDSLPLMSEPLTGVINRPRQDYVTEVRNSERNTSYWNVDLRIGKEFSLNRSTILQLSAEVFNVLDDGTYSVYNPDLERGQQVNGIAESRARFGRRWQLGAKLSF